MHKLTIITVNLNNKNGLLETINSVINQDTNQFEYLVIDGGSTDGSAELIKKYDNKISHWISKKDKGIYDAMNKGIKMAKGQYLLFLNSGDRLYDNSIVKKFINSNFTEDFVAAHIVNSKQYTNNVLKAPLNVTLRTLYYITLHHQSLFIKKDMFEKYGDYDESYKICADFKHVFECLIIKNASYKQFDCITSIYDPTGISAQEEHLPLFRAERKKIMDLYVTPRMRLSIEELIKLESSKPILIWNYIKKYKLARYLIKGIYLTINNLRKKAAR